MNIRILLNVLALTLLSQIINAQGIYEFRGNGRTGVFNESGLLNEWPDNGPNIEWTVENLPDGYSSMSIANNMIFLTGMEDTMDVAVALDMKGKILWKTRYGLSWNRSYNLSRSTPTIDEERIYVTSGLGEVACLNMNSGKILWKVNAHKEYGGIHHKWGISESLLVIDDKVFFTCGGKETHTIALNKLSGKLVWKTESLDDFPSYTSPLLIERNGKKIVVNVSAKYIYGFQTEDGKILWKFDFGQYAGGKSKRNNQTNTPLYMNGKLFVTSGYDHNSVMLNLSEDLSKVSLAWVESNLDVHHGGVVLVDGHIYGANWIHNGMGNWTCIEWETGKLKYETPWNNKGAIISADGMLYCYDEKRGNIALVKATPEKFDIKGSLKVSLGSGPHWAHPVIYNGFLYVRHGKALMAYNIRK